MEISRRDLYNRVWSTPLQHLARELDISDVGLRKACKRYGIPTPPRGYWAQLAAGTASPRPGLSPARIDAVVLNAAHHRSNTPTASVPAVDAVAVKQVISLGSREVGPFSAATGDVLAKARPTSAGFVSSGSSRAVTCLLTPATASRAVRILATVERALPSVGGRLVNDRENKRVEVEVAGERLTLAIEEQTTRTELVVQDDKATWKRSRDFVYTFSGDLRLSIGGDFQGRKSWADGKRECLEDKLAGFLSGVVAEARSAQSRC